MLVLRAPKTRKCIFLTAKHYFSRMLFFGTLKLLKSFLGPSRRFLAHFDPKMGPEINPKRDHRLEQKLTKIWSTFEHHFSKCWTTFEIHCGRKNGWDGIIPGPPGGQGGKQTDLKCVKLLSKSVFIPQELPTSCENTCMKQLQNVKLSLKSASVTSERPHNCWNMIISCTWASHI